VRGSGDHTGQPQGLTGLYVSRITSLDCPRQPIGAIHVACLQIEFADGRREWVERSTAEGQYLAPRRH
jgi:hypothetical protein